MLQHLIVIGIDTDAERLEMGPSPGDLLRIRGEGGYELGARRALEEVESMASAHTTKPSTGDFELSDRHCESDSCDERVSVECPDSEGEEGRVGSKGTPLWTPSGCYITPHEIAGHRRVLEGEKP